MAQIKASFPVFAPCADGTGESCKAYSKGVVLGKFMSVEIKPSYTDATLYGDDGVAENGKEFKEADVSLETTFLPVAADKELFGNTVSGEPGMEEVISKVDDEPKYGGFGHVSVHKENGVSKYCMTWLHKVKFTPPSEKSTTKGENITYNTPTIEGKAYADEDGQWRTKKYFKSAQEAIDALKTKAGLTVVLKTE